MLVDLAVWATVGILLNTVGYQWDSWQFWCFLGTYWAVSMLSRQRGKIEGIIDYLELSVEQQQKIKKALEEAKEDAK